MRLDASDAQALTPEHAGAATNDRGKSTVSERMRPLERLAALCDPGTLRRIDGADEHRDLGVVAAVGRVGPHPVVCYAQDSRLAGGSVGTAEAELVVHALRMARTERMPVVGFLESAGARLQEGAAALGGFGRIFFENVALHGTAPQISVITGTAAGGGCYSPALTDFTVMTRPAAMFLTGPKVVQEAVGEEISAAALGGPGVHERNGVCHFVARDDHQAVEVARELVDFLAPRGERPAPASGRGRYTGTAADPGRHVPAAAREVYDMRDVVRDIVDDGRLLEISARWARNLVVGFARIGGR
ncbi:MAG TPA: carboxyl transferase domain-containing protein, partial [Solirubrobacteraceae bacterium]|nr:carboxyl transferase domain-containing protein [Solirubrobacteraceae bacterium]